MPNYRTIDWKSVRKEDIGDLMLIFDKKYRPDGSFEKYKCRMVFRGDRYKDDGKHSRYASFIDNDSLMVFLAIAAADDLDILKGDVKTAFLKSDFPPGMVQYVRRPHGVPSAHLPFQFQLGHCAYGHPLAGHQFEQHNIAVLESFGFQKLKSAKSIMQIPATATTDQVITTINTDDMLFSMKFDSPMKQKLVDQLSSVYDMTFEDPVINYLGMTISRDRLKRLIYILQPKFMAHCEVKYPLAEGQSYPSCPMSYTKDLSKQELIDSNILLDPLQINEFQQLLGDIQWISGRSKPNIKFPTNFSARTIAPAPSRYHYNQALRIMHYCIGTKDVPRVLGGPYGAVLTGTVDSAFASWPDGKGQSAHSLHLGGGGAVIFNTSKQTLTPQSSTESEIYGNEEYNKTNIWTRGILQELDRDQRSVIPGGTPTGEDNTSCMQIIADECSSSGKTRHINLRLAHLRESLKNNNFQMFHLPTTDMIADIGTKALAPGVFNKLSDYLLGHTTLKQFLPFLTHLKRNTPPDADAVANLPPTTNTNVDLSPC